MGILPSNVATLVKPPKAIQAEMHPLACEQSQQFLATADDRLYALYVLAIMAGMRQGELLALRYRDVDLDGGSLQVRYTLQKLVGGGWAFGEPKTARSRRRITLPETAIAALKEHRRRQLAERLAAGPIWQDGGRGLVFVNPDGQPIDGIHLLRYRFLPILRQAGLPRIRFHELRHTAATLLLLQGINPKIVSELLGHSSVAITLDLYSHVLPDMQQQAAAAMDMVLSR